MEIETHSTKKNLRRAFVAAVFVVLFLLYTNGITRNPPGFYMDESATAYNAYLISRTGADESGRHFPLLIQWYTGPSTSYVSPVTIYLMAIAFRILPPSILVARAFAAFWMFSACLVLGVLAKRISGRTSIAVIVGGTALLTPWLFEESRLVWDAHFVPMAVLLFLLAAYHAHKKEKWSWREVVTLAGSLAVLTYGYFAGRVLAPFFALGLLFFGTSRDRLFGIAKVWIAYGLTLVPTLIFSWMHPGAVANRWERATYMKGVPWRDSLTEFIRRYLEDQSVIGLLQTGHPLARHHVVEVGGVFFFATFALAMLGVLFVVLRHLREPWWRFTLYGLAVSILPGAITYEPFHALRLLALPVFLLLLTVPALEWLLCFDENEARNVEGDTSIPCGVRFAALCFLLVLTLFEATRFQRIYRRDGPDRGIFFDAPYKEAYDAAVAQPQRPIYLRDGFYGPSYIDALWYSAIEGRPRSEFIHLDLDRAAKPPPGAIVLSDEQNCEQCEIIKRSGVYLLYRQK
jgi:4-amino-4-deoxy-L-arabinose transferase-like glycosyltransferase